MRRMQIVAVLVAALAGLAAGKADAQLLWFEAPKAIVPSPGSLIGSSMSAAGPGLLALAWQEIRPASATNQTSGDIFVTLSVSTDGSSWTPGSRIYGPVHYEGVTAAGYEPRVYSMVVDSADHILVAVTVSDKKTIFLQSTDTGAHFNTVASVDSGASVTTPLLFTTAGGGYVLLLSQGTPADAASGSGAVTIAYSHSSDGTTWTKLAPFIAESESIPAPRLLPSHATFKGREYVVFEAPSSAKAIASSWQVYLKTSGDGGRTWDTARPLTLATVPFGPNPAGFSNERPRINALASSLALSWERSEGDNRPKIWSARIDAGGALVGAPVEESAGVPSRFSTVFSFRGKEWVLYSDGSGAGQRWSVQLGEAGKQATILPLVNTDRGSDALFPHALVFHGALYAFWENSTPTSGGLAVIRLPPLTSVGAPVVVASDFTAADFTRGKEVNKSSATVSWSAPQPADPSGILEYRYSWLYNDGTTTTVVETKSVPAASADPKSFVSTRKLDRDGTWTFSITAKDNAGNVTAKPATVSLFRKATPPRAVSFEVLGTAGEVLLDAPSVPPENRDAHSHELSTNTFTLRWVPKDPDIDGYTYNIQPGWASLEDYRKSRVDLLSPPARVVTRSTDIPFTNSDNGVYAVTVRAIDRAGNLGAPSTIALALSGYQVVTRVDFVSSQKDPVFGTLALTINGRGFVENGPIRRIYLDRNHRGPPWDIEFSPGSPVNVTDRRISGIILDQNRESGSYRVGLLQDRPNGQQVLTFTPTSVFDFQSPGTVKLFNTELLLPRWIAGRSASYVVSSETLLVVAILVLLGVLAYLSIRRIAALTVEGVEVSAQVVALLEGRPNLRWQERNKRMLELKKRGMGLRLKFTLLMVVLVTLIVLIVSIPLGLIMVNRQQVALTDGLQSSANILLGALASGATNQYRLGNQGLGGAVKDLPSLRATMKEATYATLTGRSFTEAEASSFNITPAVSGPRDGKDFVWASDQKRFVDEFNARTFRPAQEQVVDDLSKMIPALQKKIEDDAAVKLAGDVSEYRTLSGQYKDLLARTDAASVAKAKGVLDAISQKLLDIDTKAKELYGASATTVPLVAGRLPPTYLFYKPVIYYNAAPNIADTTFFQGMIRVEVKTDDISKKIGEAYGAIFGIAGPIALFAIALGILGAVIMASITVTPIRRLARGVAVIRDTEDKEELKDHTIEVGTRDEIGSLAETVNEMTQGLVKAAVANKALLAGIDVQKRFLPLMKDKSGGAVSTAEEENARLEIFGYYKGATGVSGDYFDFKRLDDTYYALIKCDVSGKGVSAALIMVEVATLFINYFRDWPKRKENINQIKDPQARQRALNELERLEPLVYTINDMVEERGFSGRFAAFTVLLYNSATGVATLCNAGDTVLNIYSAERKEMVHAPLPNSPAAGTFASWLVDMKTPFKQVQHRLGVGDVLFLATDGFEDAIHTFRDASFREVACDEPGLAAAEHHQANLGDHEKGLTLERFGVPREDQLIKAVFDKGKFVLKRNHTGSPNEEIVFDFSTCSGTAQEVVLAMVAVDRVYRFVPDPALGVDDTIAIEPKVAEFLKAHFAQYEQYFSHSLEGDGKTGTVTFTHAKEDDQSDDLTILVLRRK